MIWLKKMKSNALVIKFLTFALSQWAQYDVLTTVNQDASASSSPLFDWLYMSSDVCN